MFDILKRTTFKHSASELSLLKIKNIETDHLAADVIFIDFKPFANISDHSITSILKRGQTLVIDSSYELVEQKILDQIAKFRDFKDQIYYFANPRDQGQVATLVNEMQQDGFSIILKQFFIDNADSYVPILNENSYTHKKYLCLTGKPTPTRTYAICLQSQYKMLDKGYVSFFTERHIDRKFDPGKIDTYKTFDRFDNASKNMIQRELKIIGKSLIVDKKIFDKKLSHSKTYNGDLYNAVDFVIVPETGGSIEQDNFFVTEKTIKCINLDKKFIVLGSKHFVKNLKDYYLKEHNKDISHLTDWCPTHYDNISSLQDRILTAIKIASNYVR